MPRNVAIMSGLIKEMIPEDEEEEADLPLPNVKKEILERVIEFLKHHENDPMPKIEKPLKS